MRRYKKDFDEAEAMMKLFEKFDKRILIGSIAGLMFSKDR